MRHPPRGDDMMVAVIPVHYVPSEQLVPVLRTLMPQWSSISAYAPSNIPFCQDVPTISGN